MIVKATFRLVHEGLAELIEPLPLVRADRRREGTGSVEAAMEVAPALGCAGVLLSGHARAAGGKPVAAAAVHLGVATDQPVIDKTLHVFGGAPFAEMPILYERAYGGEGVEENPFGTGAVAGSAPPNIVDPSDPRRPAGFGPLVATAPSRARWLAGLPAPDLEQGVPEMPLNFDHRYFQPAPQDQQLERLSGREWIVLDGMLATLPRLQTQLPGAVARAEWRAGAGRTRALEMLADMLVIDADRLLCSLIWRGHFMAGKLSEVDSLRVSCDVEVPRPAAPAASAERSLAETSDLDLRLVRPAFFPFSRGTGAPAPRREAPVPVPSPWALNPVREPLAGTSNLDVRLLRAEVVPFDDAGAATPEPPQAALLEVVTPPVILGAAPAEAQADSGPVSPDARDEAPRPPEAAEPLEDEDEDPEILVREQVLRLLAEGSSLLDVPLAGADLHDVDFSGALLSGLDMRGADLRGARFCGVRMTGVDLTGADLTGADLTGANLARAKLPRTNLAGARFTSAVMADADLSRARAQDGCFQNADMRRARLNDGDFTGADFTSTKLRGADRSGAKLIINRKA